MIFALYRVLSGISSALSCLQFLPWNDNILCPDVPTSLNVPTFKTSISFYLFIFRSVGWRGPRLMKECSWGLKTNWLRCWNERLSLEPIGGILKTLMYRGSWKHVILSKRLDLLIRGNWWAFWIQCLWYATNKKKLSHFTCHVADDFKRT